MSTSASPTSTTYATRALKFLQKTKPINGLLLTVKRLFCSYRLKKSLVEWCRVRSGSRRLIMKMSLAMIIMPGRLSGLSPLSTSFWPIFKLNILKFNSFNARNQSINTQFRVWNNTLHSIGLTKFYPITQKIQEPNLSESILLTTLSSPSQFIFLLFWSLQPISLYSSVLTVKKTRKSVGSTMKMHWV